MSMFVDTFRPSVVFRPYFPDSMVGTPNIQHASILWVCFPPPINSNRQINRQCSKIVLMDISLGDVLELVLVRGGIDAGDCQVTCSRK